MTTSEKNLFLALCKFKDSDTIMIKETLEHDGDTAAVLGELFFNRMAGIAYGVLEKSALLTNVNREFRTSLKCAYTHNIAKNDSYFRCTEWLNEILKPHTGKYAMLKGAYLCKKYPIGYRISNDIDLLVKASNVTKIGEVLSAAGFAQGRIRNEEFVPATRAEIVSCKMLRGETMPYIKKMNLSHMKYLEVDINFSLDYKSGDEAVVGTMIDEVEEVNVGGLVLTTLNSQDFFIHLCEHLYKEATAMFWVEAKRDMSLYKHSDIYMLLSEMRESDLQQLVGRIQTLGCERACYYAVSSTKSLFDIDIEIVDRLLAAICPSDAKFMDEVVDPRNGKIYSYIESDIIKRFWLPNRTKILTEAGVL